MFAVMMVPKLLLSVLLLLACFVTLLIPPRAFQHLPIDSQIMASSVLAFLVAGAMAWLICWLIIRYEDMHSHFSHDQVDSGPQKFHAVPTPRIGGIALAAGLLAGGGALFALLPQISLRDHGYLILAGLPAFLGGLIEDVTKNVGVMERLLATMLSAAIGALLLGAALTRVDILFVDLALHWMPFALFVTVVAVGGIANAMNIVDGYNGLASGLTLIALAAMAVVASQVNDVFVFSSCLAIAGGICGFMLWNWPGGKVFLGDGGAYLLGFLLGELAVLLVVRNDEVSAWFPLVLLIHPIMETLFSVYRRRYIRGHTPGRPDALHLHQLIFSRVVRYSVGTDCTTRKLHRNSMVAPYIWAPNILICIPCVLWHSQPTFLAMLALAYCVFYLVSYRLISKWRTPQWLQIT